MIRLKIPAYTGTARVLWWICLFPLLMGAFSCAGGLPRRAPIKAQQPAPAAPAVPSPEPSPGRPSSGSVSGEIRSLVEQGTPSSLLRALDLILERNLESSDFGRAMTAVSAALFQKLYPGSQGRIPPADPPPSHGYTRILREADQGVYTPPPPNSTDYLEYVLPFLAILNESRAEAFLQSRPDLWRGRQLNPGSPLAPYFLGIAFQRTGDRAAAEDEYSLALVLSPDCYPAGIALARMKLDSGKTQEAVNLLSSLAARSPGNISIKRVLALAYYTDRDWPQAESVINEILKQNSRDEEFVLLRAHVMVEQGQFLQAQAPLDLYGTIDPDKPLYLYLRARVLAEGYRNRDQALGYLQAALLAAPDDETIAIYTARFLLESSRTDDQAEGQRILKSLLNKETPSVQVLGLAAEDAIRRRAWREAENYLGQIPPEIRSTQDLFNAYQMERGLGNNAAALSYARELYRRDPSNEEGTVAYISALIDTGRQEEASRMIDRGFATLPGGSLKSLYYFQRSRLQPNEDAVIADLRSSLFEDPRNLSSLTAMFEIYHRRGDERRAVYYLKQARALAPEDPLIRRYAAEYKTLLDS